MNWYSFIFSEKRSKRLFRHFVFWLLWWIYFTTSFYHYEQTGLQKIEFEPWNLAFFTKSILLLSIHIAACYFFIDYLMPKYMFKAKYAVFTAGTVLLSFFIILTSYFIHKTVFPF